LGHVTGMAGTLPSVGQDRVAAVTEEPGVLPSVWRDMGCSTRGRRLLGHVTGMAGGTQKTPWRGEAGFEAWGEDEKRGLK
jgi:hypothetical protein